MTNPRDIPQLLIACERNGPVILGRSEGIGFRDEEFARRTAIGLTTPSPVHHAEAVTCSLPAGPGHVAVITQPPPPPEAHAPPVLLRFLFVPVELYRWLGDPFLLADRLPPSPHARGDLPMLEWPDEPLPARRVEDARAALKAHDGSLLLGAAQALVDGASIRIVRPGPVPGLVRDIWALLPDSARAELHPAEFDPGGNQVFALAIVPERPERWPPGTIDDDQVRNYPEGRFELALQIAAEAGDQWAFNRLMRRRTPREVLRAAVFAIVFTLAALAAMRLLR